ncbi:hypothetical protein TIFTF001_018552 [Ficus carica]|uniref:Integral membrane protein n=1 Tax=Ficus carica TaxID=3494 RepID=A0AA88DBS2_FICCA|nr:hypothetical protein TIFTF001_018552 [Ficus carica]
MAAASASRVVAVFATVVCSCPRTGSGTEKKLVSKHRPAIRNRLSSSSDSKLKLFHYNNNINIPTNTKTKCNAVGDSSPVYQGIYGPWTVDPSDVILYRSGLVTAAASFVVGASAAFLPDDIRGLIEQNLDLLYVLGGGGLGLSLVLIHIYVTEIKRTLQALWALGVVGSAVTYMSLAAPAGQGLVQYVVDNPTAVWFVGPLFAALTGLVFKEGLCYGKLEAGILTFIIPAVLLGHLTGLMDDGLKHALLGSWMALFVIFAGRKFSQPIKDDIGDKSVFMFNSLPEDEKLGLIEKLEQQKLGRSLD